MQEFTLKDVTYDKALDKKYNFTTIFDEINIDKQMDKELSSIYPKAYLKKNLVATRANNLIDGKEEE